MNKKFLIGFIFLIKSYFVFAQPDSSVTDNLYNMSFEDLLNVKISVASKSVEKPENAAAILSIISREEIEAYAANSLGDILNRITGAILLTSNVFENNVLAFRAQMVTPYDNHTLILINGRAVRDPVSGGWNSSFYDSFPIDIIERIEIIRGPGSVLYGSCAFSAVINIVTKKIESEGVHISSAMRLGKRNSFKQDLSAYYKNKDFQFAFGISNYITDGPFFSFTDYLGVDSAANFDKRNLGAFLGLEYKGFEFNFYYAEILGFGLNPVLNNWDLGNNFPHNNHRALSSNLAYNKAINEQLNWQNNLSYQSHLFKESANVEVFAYSLNFESILNYKPSENFSLLSGLVLENNIHHGIRFIDDEKYTLSAYAQLKYSILSKYYFIAGLQWNKAEYIKARISPRFGLIGNITNQFGFKLLYSEAFRNGYPLETSFDLNELRGNNRLKAETIKTKELQVFVHSKTFFVSLTGYYSEMNDLITRKWFIDSSLIGGGYIKYINEGAYRFYGTELEWKSALPKNLSTIGSFTWQENYDDAGLKNATLHPNIMFKMGLQFKNRFLSTTVFNSYFSKPSPVSLLNPDVLNVNKAVSDFSLLSAKLSINLSELINTLNIQKFLFYVQAQNILGKDIPYPDYPNRELNSLIPLYNGATYMIGLHADF